MAVDAKQALENYRKAGEISIEAKKLAEQIVKPSANAYDIAQKIENLIRERGAKPAFPVNFSINNEAAHYSPEILDTRTVGKNDIIKLDLGAHIDGFIVDTAITINFNPKLDELTKISKEALDAAIEMVKPGVKVLDVGQKVEEIITEAGFQPVRNLSGHQIKRYNLHAGVSIPNHGPSYFNLVKDKFQQGKVYAIEPFASTGSGEIKNGRRTNIFRVVKKPTNKQVNQAKILRKYIDKIGVLPFSPRFVYDDSIGNNGKDQITRDIQKLRQSGIIMGYPVLVEVNPAAMVSQHEHTVIVKSNGCEILT